MPSLKLSFLGFVFWMGAFSPVFGIDFVKVGMFAGGFAAGTVFHELGHATIGTLAGGKVESIKFQETIVSDLPSNEATQWMLMGGYLFQTMASEVIIENKDWHQNDFALGWMCLGVFTNLSNPIRYYIFNQKNNDLGSYESAGGDPAIPALLMVAHASWTIYRMFNQTDIPLYISRDMLGVTIKF